MLFLVHVGPALSVTQQKEFTLFNFVVLFIRV